MYWRLTTAFDCWTIWWERRVLLWFQLSEIIKKPQDETLPDYCAFAKYKYWIIVGDNLDKLLKELSLNNVSELVEKAWSFCEIEYHEEDYKWTTLYLVDSFEFIPQKEWEDIERWVDVKKFSFKVHYTDEEAINLIAEVRDLWFENKNIKNSDEYIMLKKQALYSDTIPF